jgi:hypothetical protein
LRRILREKQSRPSFVRSERVIKGFVICRFSNNYGRYLEIADYGRGGCKGRLAIPEGQNQSGWRGFNKELILLLNPILVDNKERGMNPADDNTQKRIPANERLGPVATYAESLRIPANQHQAVHGNPLTSHISVLKI